MAEEAKSYQGYCVKCKEKQTIKDPSVVVIKGKGGISNQNGQNRYDGWSW